jgi:hypothetical protein
MPEADLSILGSMGAAFTEASEKLSAGGTNKIALAKIKSSEE